MSKFTITVNDTNTFDLVSWNANSFNRNYTLKIINSSFDTIKEAFTDIKEIHINYEENTIVTTYSMFNSYSAITYEGKEYINNEGVYKEVIKITLTKTDILEQVKRLENAINPIMDIDNMNIEDYKNYVLSNIAEACQEDIFAGTTIETSLGEKLFTFNIEDQQNLSNAMNVITQSTEIEYFPFHASGDECTLFPVADLIKVYFTLQIRLTKLTTYCNMLNVYTRSLTDKEALSRVKYGISLPEEYQTKMNDIVNTSNDIVAALSNKFLNNQETIPNEEIKEENSIDEPIIEDTTIDEPIIEDSTIEENTGE